MAAVIRIKRRRNDDPAEALLLYSKKTRMSEDEEDEKENNVESVFNFAGTTTSKDDPVSSHIKEAIKRQKTQKLLQAQGADYKHSSHKYSTDLTSRLRKQTTQSSNTNRYKIISSHRALNLDGLDTENVEDSSENDSALQERTEKQMDKNGSNVKNLSVGESEHEDKENCGKPLMKKISDAVSEGASSSGGSSEVESDSQGDSKDGTATMDSQVESSKNKNAFCCLFDVEADNLVKESQQQTSSCDITVNNVPMISKKAPLAVAEEDFVYDLYYTHSNPDHLQVDAVLAVNALCDELVEDPGELSDRDVYEDEDEDSNDEGNWRNDYPNEDPRFFENADLSYDYEDALLESNMNDDWGDEGDVLCRWMDTGCRIGVDGEKLDRDGHDSGSEDDAIGAELGCY